uniref:Lipid-binding serum glycoprotein N-terminal domain-containing protein n=1 Tax=Aquila chrysaetos chrysaetos TaxID=223781 RepID=A0A663EBN9_AQUCH
NSSSCANLPAVSTALNESDVLQKMAEEAAKKKANAKLIKGISGLKVKDLRPPVISLMLSPGLGLFMAVLVQMTITGKSFIGGNMEIALAANLTASSRLWQDAAGIPRFSSRNCHIALVIPKDNTDDLPILIIPKRLVTALLNLSIPLGTAGTLQYALLNPPVTSETFIELDLKVSAAAWRRVLERDAATQLILSANFLSAALSILQTSFNLEISNNMVGDLGLRFSSRDLVIEMREAKAPVVTITPDKSLVQLYSTAEFWVSPSDSAPESLFLVRAECGRPCPRASKPAPTPERDIWDSRQGHLSGRCLAGGSRGAGAVGGGPRVPVGTPFPFPLAAQQPGGAVCHCRRKAAALPRSAKVTPLLVPSASTSRVTVPGLLGRSHAASHPCIFRRNLYCLCMMFL